MDDSLTPTDPSFDRWTQLSDALQRQLLRMKDGEEGARAEAIRLGRELDALTRLMTRDLNTASSSSA